jgi:hypothetical protein
VYTVLYVPPFSLKIVQQGNYTIECGAYEGQMQLATSSIGTIGARDCYEYVESISHTLSRHFFH